jgi:hypothetical protein
MRAVFLIAIVAVSLAACTESIKMKNTQTGQITRCGPYASVALGGGTNQAQREMQCIQDFQRQGYERMP